MLAAHTGSCSFKPCPFYLKQDLFMSVQTVIESKLTLVSEVFSGLRPVQRHQKVYGILNAELEAGVHALAIHAYTPEEWQSRGEDVPASPNCLGGSKHDKP